MEADELHAIGMEMAASLATAACRVGWSRTSFWSWSRQPGAERERVV